MTIARRWRERAAELVGIDLRSLALLRVGLAAVVLCDLASRAQSLRAHYSDAGVLPRSAALVWLPFEARLSVHLLGGEVWYQGILFSVAALAAVALAAGWHSRAATVVSWYLVFSLQVRNPAVDHGGDNVLRLMLFWAMFLPLGARWSCDRAAGRLGEPPGPRVVSVGAFAARLQLCLVYWVTAARKWNPAWWSEATALSTALQLDYLSTSWGGWLGRFPRLLRWATRGTLALEALGPLAAWSPLATGPVRCLVVLAFVLFHLGGIAPALRLGIFPWVCAVAWSLFLPGWFWERLGGGRLGRLLERLDRFDRRGQEAASRRAEVAAAGGAGPPPPSAAAPAPAGARARWGHRLASGVAALLCVFVVLWDLREASPSRFGRLLPPASRWVAEALALHQTWAMFTPSPPTDAGWFVVAGRTREGDAVDPWRESPLDPSRPASFAAAYGDSRWTKYLSNLRLRGYVFHRRLFGNYLCRRWNADHSGPRRLLGLSLVYMLEPIEPSGRRLAAQPLLLFAQPCPP
jgi:Vitamin K-dependent gamma-carboxylase